MAYQTVTLAQLTVMLAERYEQQPFWTADQARRAINEGLRVYNLITGMYRAKNTLALVPDDTHVFVGGSLVKGTWVTVAGVELTLTSINALDKAVPDWQGVNTAAGGDVPTMPRFWTPIGLTEIQVYPAIDGTLLGLTAIVNGVRSTPILTLDADFLNMGEEEISTLLGYALHVLSFAKGIEALQRTLPLRVAFFKACALRNAAFAGSSLYRKIIGYDRTRAAQPMVDADSMRAGNEAAEVLTQGGGGGNQ